MIEFYNLSMAKAPQLLVLAFLAITFLQSGFDKITDWKGNLSYIKSVFEKTFLKKSVPFLLTFVTFGEIIGGLLTLAGIIQIYFYQKMAIGLLGAVICAKILLALLFGQRVAKDYAGAMTIAVYFIIAVFGVWILQN
jgi:uncharacterized membrane protein YphA (DoxX/SURF4 family)